VEALHTVGEFGMLIFGDRGRSKSPFFHDIGQWLGLSVHYREETRTGDSKSDIIQFIHYETMKQTHFPLESSERKHFGLAKFLGGGGGGGSGSSVFLMI
jgi:hypothetical protein